jgi:hypothetical protein
MKMQLTVVLATGEIFKSTPTDFTEDEKLAMAEMLKAAAGDRLGHMSFTRDNGAEVYITAEALRNMRFLEFGDVVE